MFLLPKEPELGGVGRTCVRECASVRECNLVGIVMVHDVITDFFSMVPVYADNGFDADFAVCLNIPTSYLLHNHGNIRQDS